MNTKLIYEAVYNGLIIANTKLNFETYNKVKIKNHKIKNEILKNAYLANKNQRPLCQDTGQVVVFLNIGQNVVLEGEFIYDSINKAVSDCYKDNFFRKSTVKDAVFDRTNTGDNTPAIIHTNFIKGDEISILIGIKGGGSENMTRLKMMNPTSSIDDVYDFVKETVLLAGENACPPMTVGIGAGGTAEVAAKLAKLALFKGKPVDLTIENVLDVKMLTTSTHIASLPVCVNINCHSVREIEIKIKENKIYYDFKDYNPMKIENENDAIKVNSDDIEALKKLKTGDKILLSGKIYTARDMAHKRLYNSILNNEKLPIDIKNSIIFYAGPCPKKEGEIIGPIGPTTSKRMDKFAPLLYENGVIATIGKGQRTFSGGYLYLKATGGVALLYQQAIKSAKIAAYEDLGTEAIYELEVSNMPLTVEIL